MSALNVILRALPKVEPYFDEEGFGDLVCKNEVDVGAFGDDQPRPGPCKNNTFFIQGNEDGRFRFVCSKCGHTVTIQTVPSEAPQ